MQEALCGDGGSNCLFIAYRDIAKDLDSKMMVAIVLV